MTPGSSKGLVCLGVLALLCLFAEPRIVCQVEGKAVGSPSRHERSLLATPQQISQCDWITGEGCALHPSYVSYILNRTNSDTTATYVANAIACAGVVDKGACEGTSYCSWDQSFASGQQGCFLHESALLALQLQCIKPHSRDSLSKLQSCMAARHSCQCYGDSSSACQVQQQQLLTSYSSSSSKVCESLLGCWLSKLNGSSPDLTQLVEVQLVLVQPKLESLINSSSSGRRRILQIVPSLNEPIVDDTSHGASTSLEPKEVLIHESAAQQIEPGHYTDTGFDTPDPKPVAETPAFSVGMNGGITGDIAASPTAATPVENPGGIPAAVRSQPADSAPGTDKQESGMPGDGWNPEMGAPGSNTSEPSSSEGSSGSNAGSAGEGVQMTGGNAPASFWQCASSAAAKADTTRKWADVDDNSKSLTLNDWIKVIQPTALIDWGIEMMECFKAEVSSLAATAGNDVTEPNKESMEYAIVALIRSFTAQADSFRTYLQAGSSSQVTAGLASLQRLVDNVYPGQLQGLLTKHSSAPAYRHDVMLQAAAIIADMQWFMSDAIALASSTANAAQQQQVFEGVINYGEEMMRSCLYWMFHLQFDGPASYVPDTAVSTTGSDTSMEVFEGLAAALFPASDVAADAPAYQQLRTMIAVAAGWAANAVATMKADGKMIDAAAVLGNVMDGLAKAHLHDFWGTRLELARYGAPAAARDLALTDPNQSSVLWRAVREQELKFLAAIQQQTAARSQATTQQLGRSLQGLLSASGAFLRRVPEADAATQQRQFLDALQYSAYLASLIRQCHGSPVGLKALNSAAAAAAGVPLTASAACAQLSAAVNQITAATLGDSGEVLVQSLAANLNRQFVCNSQDTDSCLSTSGCNLALAATTVPGSSSSTSPPAANLLLGSTADSDFMVVCQADDAGLQLSSWANSTKSELALGSQCEQFLQMPECERLTSPATCGNFAACNWELTGQRNQLHSMPRNGSSDAAATAAASGQGACSYNWMHLLRSTEAYGSVSQMAGQCSSINDEPMCHAQVLMLTMAEVPEGDAGSPVRFLVPALVAAVALAVLLFAAAIWFRRRSTAARRAAEERAGSGGAGKGKKQKVGKGGKVNKQQLKSKVKRAEPGSYKPDLMRDSFTDYMREAPTVAAGVAVAKAAQEAGLQNAAAVTLAQGDVAGGRIYQPGSANSQDQYGSMASGRTSSPSSISPPSSVPYPTAAPGNLIDIDTCDALTMSRGIAVVPAGQPPLPYVNSLAYPMHSQPVWGAAAPGAANRLSGGLGSAGIGGSGLLSGGLTEVDSLALTSSLGLVSSLPQPHGSVAIGEVPQLGVAGQVGMQQQLGLLQTPEAAGRMNRGMGPMDPAYSANSGSLLLGTVHSREQHDDDEFRDVEEGASTPTSSCHDSVFSRATSRVGQPAAASTTASSSSWRGRVAGAVPGLNPALSGALSGALSRSSWSSAMSTDQLMSSQPSAQL